MSNAHLTPRAPYNAHLTGDQVRFLITAEEYFFEDFANAVGLPLGAPSSLVYEAHTEAARLLVVFLNHELEGGCGHYAWHIYSLWEGNFDEHGAMKHANEKLRQLAHLYRIQMEEEEAELGY